MREILFRGKAIDCNEWVYGYLLLTDDRAFIHPVRDGLDFGDIDFGYGFIQVKPDTICEYTGIDDKFGNKIFEYDIIKANGWGNRHSWSNFSRNEADIKTRRVVWGDGAWILYLPYEDEVSQGFTLCRSNQKRFEIIGNIFDNPELAKV